MWVCKYLDKITIPSVFLQTLWHTAQRCAPGCVHQVSDVRGTARPPASSLPAQGAPLSGLHGLPAPSRNTSLTKPAQRSAHQSVKSSLVPLLNPQPGGLEGLLIH